MPKSSDAVVMPRAEFEEEHERLLGVLESPSHADDLEEAERQREEMEGEVKKAEPSEAQRKAGNYAKAHWRIHGMEVSIENLAGSTRSGVDPSGKAWSVTLPYHYGYIRGTVGADGDHLDCMIGPLHDKGTEVTIINQKNPGGREFDEHKVMLGYPSREQALAAFHSGRSDDPNEVMDSAITVPVETFKEWLDKGSFKKKLVLKADPGPMAEEFAKAEKQAHIKGHYRHINGKVVYVQDYDKTVHGDHPEATLHQRTVTGKTDYGHFIRATDPEDAEKINEAAKKAGVELAIHEKRGKYIKAKHHGRESTYPTFWHPDEAAIKKVHDMLGTNDEIAAKLDAPSPKADTGPVAGPDKGPDKTERKNAEHEAAIKSVYDKLAKFTSDTDSGLSKAELLDAHANREDIASQVASLAAKGIMPMKEAASIERKLISAHAFPIREDHLDGAQALVDATSIDFADSLLAGIFAPDQLEEAKKLSGLFETVKGFNTEQPEANDPMVVGKAFSDAAHINKEKLEAMLANGKPKMGPGPKETVESVLSGIIDKTQKAYMAIDMAASDVIGTFNSAKEKSVGNIGYVEPSLYNFAIHATKKRLALAHGSGMGGDIEHVQAKLAGYEAEKAAAQKFHDYHGLDAEALMATSPDHPNAHTHYKMAALGFQHKAKALQNKGNHSGAAELLNKAKAAASIALAHANK